mmetsp:Transcript_23620/g.51555  ORF Transcript_23620/g.51555 Transcript_23620/m.51555 type:complete len:450 (-) Transcript_23620:426-1775(-)
MRVVPFPRAALHAKLIAVVEAWKAWEEHEQRRDVREVRGVLQGGGNAGNIVVADEVEERKARVQLLLAQQCRCQLVKVVVVQRGPHGFRQLVVGAGVEAVVAHPGVVVAVNHLSHQQAVRGHRVAHRAELPPEVGADLVRHVQPPPVDAHLNQPIACYLEDVLPDRRLREVQTGKHRVALPAVVGEAVLAIRHVAPALVVLRARTHDVPVRVLALVRTLLLKVPEGEVPPPGVIEHAIQHNPDAACVALLHHLAEERLVAQAPVNFKVVGGVIPVGVGLEEGGEVDGGDAELLQEVEVLGDEREPRHHRRLVADVQARGAEEPQGEDLIEHRVLRPLGNQARLVRHPERGFGVLLRVDGDGRGRCGHRRMVRGPVLRHPLVPHGNLVALVGCQHVVGAALPDAVTLGIPTVAHDILVLNQFELRKLDSDLPSHALDPVHGHTVCYVPGS